MNLNCITGNNDHLYKHIKQSFYKAKSIDIIVSFLMESGVKLLRKDLEEISNKNIPIRILTGNYLNITQPSALYLIKDILGDNVDLRFYNDTKRSFHPKAYIFEYEDGGEIFIGSSNLSKSALTEGIEWNYRIDKYKNIDDYKYFKDMFEDLFYNESIIVNDQELET
ncbi:phospholipase D-like domain-containing protein [Paraclostridium bifermentans]